MTASDKRQPRKSAFQPVSGFRTYLRNLPHWERPGSAYFVTFRSLFPLPDEAKTLVLECVRFRADKKYTLHACAVMDDHVHLILSPLERTAGSFYSLIEIMHSIKSY